MPKKIIMTVIHGLSLCLIMPGPVAAGNTDLATIRQVNRRSRAVVEFLSRERVSAKSAGV